jgi:hypothetical protein
VTVAFTGTALETIENFGFPTMMVDHEDNDHDHEDDAMATTRLRLMWLTTQQVTIATFQSFQPWTFRHLDVWTLRRSYITTFVHQFFCFQSGAKADVDADENADDTFAHNMCNPFTGQHMRKCKQLRSMVQSVKRRKQ